MREGTGRQGKFQTRLYPISGAKSKGLLVRYDDVQALHGFDPVESDQGYLSSTLVTRDVVEVLKPYLNGNPEVSIYGVA